MFFTGSVARGATPFGRSARFFLDRSESAPRFSWTFSNALVIHIGAAPE
jgi:hypothetical protein